MSSKLEDVSKFNERPANVEDYYENIFACFVFEEITTLSESQLQFFLDFMNNKDFKEQIIQLKNLDAVLQGFILNKFEYSKSTNDNIKQLVKSLNNNDPSWYFIFLFILYKKIFLTPCFFI